VRGWLREDESWLEQLLSPENLKKLRDEHAKARAADFGLNLYHYLYLADLITILAKHEPLRAALGFKSRGQAERELDFTEVRNRVRHPTGFMITSRQDLEIINQACARIIHLSSIIEQVQSGEHLA
jgi:hypothetical protein